MFWWIRRTLYLARTQYKVTMTLIKVTNPVYYAFLQWMNNSPDSGNWCDKNRFFVFAKTVCRYNASKWKSELFVEKQILSHTPSFDRDRLQNLLALYANLLEFYEAIPITSSYTISDKEASAGYCIEIMASKGKLIEKEVPLKL